uniref:Uncharacterized protein n=1 Tax=Alexandrium catenella TaxID=2925 RepID=A0A7S1W840_ALECA
MSRWRGATVVAPRPTVYHNHLTPEGMGMGMGMEASFPSQRPEYKRSLSGPLSADALDHLGQQVYYATVRRSRSLVASPLSRHFLETQSDYGSRPVTSECSRPLGMGEHSRPLGMSRTAGPFNEVREGFMGGHSGRTFLNRPGLVGKGQLSLARLPWEVPMALPESNARLASSVFEMDSPGGNRATGFNLSSQHWHGVRFSRDKRLHPTAPAAALSNLMVTGARPWHLERLAAS